MRLTTRRRSIVAAVATVAALICTSLGRSPVDGPVGRGLLVLWALGICAGVVAFVAWASVFSEVAQQRSDSIRTAESTQQAEPFA